MITRLPLQFALDELAPPLPTRPCREAIRVSGFALWRPSEEPFYSCSGRRRLRCCFLRRLSPFSPPASRRFLAWPFSCCSRDDGRAFFLCSSLIRAIHGTVCSSNKTDHRPQSCEYGSADASTVPTCPARKSSSEPATGVVAGETGRTRRTPSSASNSAVVPRRVASSAKGTASSGGTVIVNIRHLGGYCTRQSTVLEGLMVVCPRSFRPSIPCVHQRRGQLTNHLAGQGVPVSVLHLLQLPQNALSAAMTTPA